MISIFTINILNYCLLIKLDGINWLIAYSAFWWIDIVLFIAFVSALYAVFKSRMIYKSRIEVLEKTIRLNKPDEKNNNTIHEFPTLSTFNTQSGNSIMLFDSQGNLEWVNGGFHAITGYTKEEFIKLFGNSLFEISTNKEIKNQIEEAVNQNKSVNYISNNISKDGKSVWMLTTITPVFDNNRKLTHYLCIDTNITHIKAAEEEILKQKAILEEERNRAVEQKAELEKAFKKSSKHHIQLQKALWMNEKQKDELEKLVEVINRQNRELEKANFEIKETSRMKEIFLANTSHEIRTPLNAIMGFTNLLLNTNPNPVQAGYLQNIKSSGDNLLVVINDILDFSKIESGKITFEKIGFNLFDIVEHCISTLNVKAIEKNQTIKWHIDNNIPKILIGDPVRLNQILNNLIGNSIKFTPANGKIQVNIEKKEEDGELITLEFRISDSGIGIPKDKLDGIFESFTQAESDTTRKYGGTGLGLAIVKQLVQLQNGKIWVESELNKGTTFYFQLHFKPGTIDEMKADAPEKKKINKPLPDNMRILLVEDNRINQQLALDTLKQWNKTFTIDLAENGREAIEKISQNNYHLVLMDIQMPEMDGREATIHIRNKMPEPKKSIPIIAMTAHALKDEREKCISLGMNDYVSKPFDPNELYNKILLYSPTEKIEPAETNQMPANETEKDFSSDFHLKIKNLKFIDLSQFIKIYKNDEEKIKKILLMYLESTAQEINDLKINFETVNWHGMMTKAHVLKTKMNYLGIKGLAEAARLIENFAKEQSELEKISKLVDIMLEDWIVVQEEIRSLTS